MWFRPAGSQVLSGKTNPLGNCLPTWEHFSSFTQPLCLMSGLLVFSISLPSGSSFLPVSHLELWFPFIIMSTYFLHINYPFLLPSSWHCLVQLLPAPGFVLHQVGGKDCSQQPVLPPSMWDYASPVTLTSDGVRKEWDLITDTAVPEMGAQRSLHTILGGLPRILATEC